MAVNLERHPAVTESDLPAIYASMARDDRGAVERLLDAGEQTFEQLKALLYVSHGARHLPRLFRARPRT